MNKDLISRDALKEALNEIFDTVEVVTFDDIIDIIDNAPTVEQNWRFYYDHGYKQAERDLKRTQGEWLKLSNMSKRSYQRFCSNCHHIAYFCGTGNYPFCPYCKAEMKSEEDTKI